MSCHKACNKYTAAGALLLEEKKKGKVSQTLLFNYQHHYEVVLLKPLIVPLGQFVHFIMSYPALIELHLWYFMFKAMKWVLQIMYLTDTSSSQKKGIPFSTKTNFLFCCWTLQRMWAVYHCASQEVLLLNMLCRRQVLVEMILVERLVSFIFYGIVHAF